MTKFPYLLLNKNELISSVNQLAGKRNPFLLIVNYNAENGYVIKQEELDNKFVRFQMEDKSQKSKVKSPIDWIVKPIDFKTYKSKFEFVQQQIYQGNSFLTNLTQPTEITTNLTLTDLFEVGEAKYKLWLNGLFTVLSPETFVQIRNGFISSFPMKGTIDASQSNAEETILNDPKEKAEHATIVDLIRNDLSLVAEHVVVKRYRYVDKLTTNKGDLLQVSSEISGRLPKDYLSRFGDILFSLLPAGSISGAPKPKTLEIINEAEGYDRSFYTGICGWFDGENFDSAVMIRFIEQKEDKLIFKSGGGITAQSEVEKEYQELIQKVYVPIC